MPRYSDELEAVIAAEQALRRRIAERMQQSKRKIPHYSYVEELDVTELEELRAHLFAHNRRFKDCVELLQRMGAEQKALEMFADLRMFEQAQVREKFNFF